MAQRSKTTDGAAILAAREDAGLSQQELAGLCGITPSYLCRIETGREKPGPTDTVRLIAQHLNVDVDDITVAVAVSV